MRFSRPAVLLMLIVGSLLVIPAVVQAALVSQGYLSSKSLQDGAIVSSVSGQDNTVVAADSITNTNIIGAVATPDERLLEAPLGSQGGSEDRNQVQVVTGGSAKVLVSDINGEVKAGDPIAGSAIEGAGAKALASGRILGFAAEDLSAATDTQTQEITSKEGVGKDAKVGLLRVNIQIGIYYPSDDSTGGRLQKFAEDLAGKPVSILKLVVVCLLAGMATLFAFTVLSGAVRNGVVALGRNPLAKRDIYSGLQRTVVFSMSLMLVAYGVCWLILRV